VALVCVSATQSINHLLIVCFCLWWKAFECRKEQYFSRKLSLPSVFCGRAKKTVSRIKCEVEYLIAILVWWMECIRTQPGHLWGYQVWWTREHYQCEPCHCIRRSRQGGHQFHIKDRGGLEPLYLIVLIKGSCWAQQASVTSRLIREFLDWNCTLSSISNCSHARLLLDLECKFMQRLMWPNMGSYLVFSLIPRLSNMQ